MSSPCGSSVLKDGAVYGTGGEGVFAVGGEEEDGLSRKREGAVVAGAADVGCGEAV